MSDYLILYIVLIHISQTALDAEQFPLTLRVSNYAVHDSPGPVDNVMHGA